MGAAMSPSEADKPAEQRTGRDPRLMFLLALGAYLAFGLLLPWVPLPRHRPPLAALLALVALATAAFMLLQLWLAQAVVSLKPRAGVSALLMVLSVVSLIAINRFAPGSVRLLLVNLAITSGCAFFGILLSRIIREPNVLLPVALVAMPIDYLGAMTPIGFTQNMVARHPEIVKNVSVTVPAVGGAARHHGGLAPLAFIGPGDALFMAFFFAVALRLHLNVRGTFWWTYGLLTATMLLVLATDINIAALIPMGLAVLFANFRYFRLKREEVFATLYAGVLILALVSGFYFYSHTHFYRSDSKDTPDAHSASPRPTLPPGR